MAQPKETSHWIHIWQDLVDELEDSLDILYSARTDNAIIASVSEVTENLRNYLSALESDEGV